MPILASTAAAGTSHLHIHQHSQASELHCLPIEPSVICYFKLSFLTAFALDRGLSTWDRAMQGLMYRARFVSNTSASWLKTELAISLQQSSVQSKKYKSNPAIWHEHVPAALLKNSVLSVKWPLKTSCEVVCLHLEVKNEAIAISVEVLCSLTLRITFHRHIHDLSSSINIWEHVLLISYQMAQKKNWSGKRKINISL